MKTYTDLHNSTPLFDIPITIMGKPPKEWRNIKGYGDHYEVCNNGVVRSKFFGYESISKSGLKYKNTHNIRVLTPTDNGTGYKQVHLSSNGKGKQEYVHRLVAKSFIPNPNSYPEVNHLNGKKDDNRAENLEWCTRSENEIHAYSIGLKNQGGERNNLAKLDEDTVRYIRWIYEVGNITMTKLGKIFDVERSNIGAIINRRTWKNI